MNKARNRTLAIRAHHLHSGHRTTGMTEGIQGSHHAIEREIHAPLIKRGQQITETHVLSVLRVDSRRESRVLTSRLLITSGGTIRTT